MRLLLVNDDGIHGEGLQHLARTLAKDHVITVVAPILECSATSHHTTLFSPVKVIETQIPDLDAACYAVHGMPSDCVKIALNSILAQKPDMVISGINCGANLGTDVIYSGTVAAAMEGAIAGVKSLAFSVASHFPANYDTACRVASDIILQMCDLDVSEKTIINVNVPDLPLEQIKGSRICPLGICRYIDWYEEHTDSFGRKYYWLRGEACDTPDDAEDSDVSWVSRGYITLTPLWYDLTNRSMLDKMAALAKENGKGGNPIGET